jgi:hypothetical protein
MIGVFDEMRPRLRAAVRGGGGPEREAVLLDAAYDRLGRADFTSDFLARATPSTLVFSLEDVLWCDWGRPKRLMQSIQALGLDAAPRQAHAL